MFPVLGILGPRQIGKTTLSREIARDWVGADDWTFTGIVAHNHDDLYPCNPTPTYPMDRLRCGANLLGKLTEWDAEDAENGVEH